MNSNIDSCKRFSIKDMSSHWVNLGGRSYDVYYDVLWRLKVKDFTLRIVVYNNQKPFRIVVDSVSSDSSDTLYNSESDFDAPLFTGVRAVNSFSSLLLTKIKNQELLIPPVYHQELGFIPVSICRGGRRENSGRKKGIDTKLMRVPVEFESDILSLIAQLKDSKGYTLTKKEKEIL